MTGNSWPVISNQNNVSGELETIVRKHLITEYKKPLHPFSQSIFDELAKHIQANPASLILDSGCGNGNSSFILASLHPDCLVIGIDKSRHRLGKHLKEETLIKKDNVILVHADLIDLWRLMHQSGWKIEKHYLLYPNPWPKKEQIKRRWQGHPIFPEILNLGKKLELRTNWYIYAEEFQLAVKIAKAKQTDLKIIKPDKYISPFEKKYHDSGHKLYNVLLR